jgi:hypothetical protein
VREDRGRVWVALAEPDRATAEQLERVLKRPVRQMVAPLWLITRALERLYGVAAPETELGHEDVEIVVDDAPEPAVAAATGFLDEALPRAPRPLSELFAELAEASSDQATLDALMGFLLPELPRQCVLALRQGELTPLQARGLELSSLRGARAAVAELPLVEDVLATGEAYVGRLSPAALGSLAAPLGVRGPVPGVLLPLRVGGQPRGCLVGLDASPEGRRKAELDQLAQRLDHALHIHQLRRLLLAP